MSTIFFVVQLNSGILPVECFPLTYYLNGFKSRINRHPKRFPVGFSIFVLLFLVTPCLVVAVQPCMKCEKDGRPRI